MSLKKLGLQAINAGAFSGVWHGNAPPDNRGSPIDGGVIARVRLAGAEDYEVALSRAQDAFLEWREVPAPIRGETVRRFGNALRAAKAELANLVTLESGKIIGEAEGEVQEMIDIC